jgi:hypothetical protein
VETLTHNSGKRKSTGKGNLVGIFGKPDIAILSEKNGWLLSAAGYARV